MESDWITIYLLFVLIISIIPLLLLFAWKLMLYWEEIKELRIFRREVYFENMRTLMSGTTDIVNATANV